MAYPPIPRSVLVTGCSTGIGLATATVLQARGWRVFATARKPNDLAMLTERGCTAIALDLASSDSVLAAAARVRELCGDSLGAIVNNAGVGQPGACEDLSRAALREQFETNVFGLHELTCACLPLFLRQRAGRIVNISSVLGRVTLPFMGAYCASKHALESLTDAMRVELVDTGVGVSLVEPGPIITAFRSTAMAEGHLNFQGSRFGALLQQELNRRRGRQKQPGFINKPPEAVAEKILHALESPRPRRRYCVTPSAYAGAWLRRLAPDAFMDAMLVRRVRQLQTAVDAAGRAPGG